MPFALSSPISTSVRWAAVAPGPRIARRAQYSKHQGIQAADTKHMVYTKPHVSTAFACLPGFDTA